MFSRINSRMERSWIEECMKNVLEHRDKQNKKKYYGGLLKKIAEVQVPSIRITLDS
jgi:hypothetical protein